MKNKTRRRLEWCPQETRYVSEGRPGDTAPAPLVRCPTCNKRIRLKTNNSEPFGSRFEPYYRYPAHKRWTKAAPTPTEAPR